MSGTMLESALAYAARGWPVLPLHTPGQDGQCSCHKVDCPSNGKHPRTMNGVKGATTDRATIERWWGMWPDANIGIRTGAESGLVVLDIDPRHGGDETLAELERAHGKLPDTIKALTGGGGRHILFAHPGGKVPSKNGIAPGLDRKADGGYIVAAPSGHKSGGQYQWQNGLDVALAPAPAWVLDTGRKETAPPRPVSGNSNIEQAVARFNADHPLRWPAECPLCQKPTGFKPLAGDESRWICFHASHPDCGIAGEGCHHGDALDLEAFAVGRSRVEHLKAEGYLEDARRPGASPPTDDDAPADDDQAARLTDVGNASRFAKMHEPSLRFVPGAGWHAWDGRRWRRDETGAEWRCARETARSFFSLASDCLRRARTEESADKRDKLLSIAEAYEAHGKKSESEARLRAMVRLAESETALLATISDLDRDPWLLNCLNGTVDLRTGELHPHRRSDLLAKVAGAECHLGAPAPLWDAFLARVQPDPEVRAYLARLCGYWLTGLIREHVLPIHWGTGRNGKGVFHNTIRHVMGDYARQIPPELLMARKYEAHPTERMVLLGCRLAIASETEEGRSLNVALVKALTGGDTISARLMREDFIEFAPTHKLSLNTNHRPRIRETKDAIWERVHLIPWTVFIPAEERDLALEEKLRAEAAGILSWAINGCAEWQRIGLSPPAAVKAATEEYRGDEDTFGDFIEDCCFVAPLAKAPASALYAEYGQWCETTGERPMSQRAFAGRLADRGFQAAKSMSTRYWRGIGLLADRDARDARDTDFHMNPCESQVS